MQLTVRELRRRVLSVGVGWLWLVLTPLLLLGVYVFVFGVIFQARVPDGLQVPFALWLAVALWPWFAFSDGVLSGARAVRDNAALISKIAVPRAVLVLSYQTAAFLLQLMGYLVVLAVIQSFSGQLTLVGFPNAVLTLLLLYAFSAGLSLGLSALQVFFRDLEQLLPILMMFWFFLTPILYTPELLPPDIRHLIFLNPVTWWVEELRSAFFLGKAVPDLKVVVFLFSSALAVMLGSWVFRRLSPHFEDFL
ncbi:ABC transporter permease [Wenzhouxiangella limi]|uniref:Transport permease protein n=1 Tax=Wenzhouxiangella limi TaxID=2707351 RepID=A0A845UTZ2_9GAMM|nr:ABC transporter permease [Wenzhouxiangella limi]NDY94977.1 ABC transporter permease [Wenzhouxiangella limi]